VINLYDKIGVNTRAGATLFAFEHDRTDPANQGEIVRTVDSARALRR